MVHFGVKDDGVSVEVDGRSIGSFSPDGHLEIPCPVSLNPRVISLSDDDLVEIGRKAREVKLFGLYPKQCQWCKGTPFFPNQITSADGVDLCIDHAHHF